MKRTRHTSEQIIGKLRKTDAMPGAGTPIGAVCQKLEISEGLCAALP